MFPYTSVPQCTFCFWGHHLICIVKLKVAVLHYEFLIHMIELQLNHTLKYKFAFEVVTLNGSSHENNDIQNDNNNENDNHNNNIENNDNNNRNHDNNHNNHHDNNDNSNHTS